MQLYTVEMTTKHLVSIFDDRGRKVREEEKFVPMVMRDLPLQTAQMYREKNPDGNVKLIAQAQTVVSERFERAKSGQYAHDFSERKAKKQTASYVSQSKSPAAAPKSKVEDAARSGDMSAAINQR